MSKRDFHSMSKRNFHRVNVVEGIFCCCIVSMVAAKAFAGPAEDLKAFVGNRPAKVVAVDRADSNRLYLLDTESGELKKLSESIDCNSPLFSADGKRIVYNQNGKVFIHTIADAKTEEVVAGTDGHFWIDDTGEEWIYYTTSSKETKLYWPDSKNVTTRRVRLSDKKDELVLDWKGNGGVSQDGTHLGAAYATVIIFNLPEKTHSILFKGEQGCNPSMAPDNSYLMMLLDLPHEKLWITNQEDQIMWMLDKPADQKEWQNPEWSTDGDFAVATAKTDNSTWSVYAVQISTSKTQKILEGQDWSYPHLWIANSQRAVPSALLKPLPTDGGTNGDQAGSSDGGTGGERKSEDSGCSFARGAQGCGMPLMLLLSFACMLLFRRRGK